MSTPFEDAVLALHRLPPESFVSERKRLAAVFKGEGQKEAAERLARLQRPTVSVWLVNQLYDRERARFDQLFASAAAQRSGDRASSAAHRETLAELRDCALALLAESGRPVQDAVVRRVMTTLSTLAANGGFDPDLPGALTSDREAVGFGFAMSFPEAETIQTPAAIRATAAEQAPEVDPAERARELDRARAAEAARAREVAREQRAAEQARLEAASKQSEALVNEREREVERLRAELDRAERELTRARQSARDAATQLATLNAGEDA